MSAALLFVQAVAHAVLLVVGIGLMRRHRIPEMLIPMAICAALVYENLLLAFGERIGEGDALRLGSIPRYVAHGMFTPLLIVFGLCMAARLGLRWFEGKRVLTLWGAVVFGCLLGGILFDVIKLELAPEREGGLLRYVNHGGGPPVVEIVTVNALLIIGGVIARSSRIPWLFLGSQAMLIIALFWAEDMVIANAGEVLLLAGAVFTGRAVLARGNAAATPSRFAPGVVSTDAPDTERTRAIVRWNRRLGWALLVLFPLSYLTNHLAGDGKGALHTTDVLVQFFSTVVLLLHAAQSFRVFGFPSMRRNLRTVNGYASYLVLLVYLLSQASIGTEPAHKILVVFSFTVIGIHVVLSILAAHRRPKRTGDLRFGDDVRSIADHDREQVARVQQRLTAGRESVAAAASASGVVPVLQAQRLDVALGGVQVLFGVDVTINRGEIVALLGNNGAGKTTLLRTLAGLESPKAGRVSYFGVPIASMTAAARARMGLSLVVGGRALFDSLTVDDNLALFATRVEDANVAQQRIGEVVAMFPWIGERRHQAASSLSGGEQQILAVAQALIVQPDVVLVDEFSLGLAPRVIGQLVDLLRVVNERGTSVMLVEQSSPLALSVADRAYVLDRGRIALEASAAELREHPERLSAVLFAGTASAGAGPVR